MRLSCNVHGFVDAYLEMVRQCPYCEIDRLTAERDEMKATLHNLALDWQVITAENQRLREALEMLANDPWIEIGCREIAREALTN